MTFSHATTCACGDYDRHDYDHGVSRCEPQTTTTTPCEAFRVGCGGQLNTEGVCTTCGAIDRPTTTREDR